MNKIPEIDVVSVKDRIDAGNAPYILDVRENEEYEFSNIGGNLIPLDELPDRLDELKKLDDQDIVVMCRTGGRSAQAVSYLINNGFENVYNMKGGIHAWSNKVDPSVQKY